MSDPVRPLDEFGMFAAGESSPPASATTRASRFTRPGGRSPLVPARDASPTRQRILDVARELFCSRGYERTPLRTISDALGVTKAALYYHFRAKNDLLVGIVAPTLDRIDEMLDLADPTVPPSARQRVFLVAYVEELATHSDIIALLIRDHGVGEHPLGRRFAFQHTRMRELLGAGDGAASAIRATTALRALELAVIEFAGADRALLREIALNMAVAVLDS